MENLLTKRTNPKTDKNTADSYADAKEPNNMYFHHAAADKILRSLLEGNVNEGDRIKYSASLLNINGLEFKPTVEFFDRNNHLAVLELALNDKDWGLKFNLVRFINSLVETVKVDINMSQELFNAYVDYIMFILVSHRSSLEGMMFASEALKLLSFTGFTAHMQQSSIPLVEFLRFNLEIKDDVRIFNKNLWDLYYRALSRLLNAGIDTVALPKDIAAALLNLLMTHITGFEAEVHMCSLMTNVALKLLEVTEQPESHQCISTLHDYALKAVKLYAANIDTISSIPNLFEDNQIEEQLQSFADCLELGQTCVDMVTNLMRDSNYSLMKNSLDLKCIDELYYEALKLSHIRSEFFVNLVHYASLNNRYAICDTYLSIISTGISCVLDYIQMEMTGTDQLVLTVDFFAAEFRSYCLIIQRFAASNIAREVVPYSLLDKVLNLLMYVLDSHDSEDDAWTLISRFDLPESINIFHFMYNNCKDKDIVLEIMDILSKQVKHFQLNTDPKDMLESIKKVNTYCLEIVLKEETLILLAGAVNLVIEIYAYDNYDDLFDNLKVNPILKVN